MTIPSLTSAALSSRRYDRAIGAVVASAAGDALGSRYEFGPALPDDVVPEFGVGYFGHEVGQYTDDTEMAVPILAALARGESLNDAVVLGSVATHWCRWARTAKDVGAQTSSVLSRLDHADVTESAARTASRAVHEQCGRSGGNGALMRTGPVALGYLDDGCEEDLVDAAGRLAQMTHWEFDNVDAVVLWCLAIRHAIRTGSLDLPGQLLWLPEGRRERWSKLIAEASEPGAHPRDFASGNGWVVRAFQAALAAVTGAHSLTEALQRAVRGGGDTDTVAAITGSLAGAVFGATAVPLGWLRVLHGVPNMRAVDLTRMAFLAARGGRPSHDGWPLVAHVPTNGFLHTPARRHPHDDGVWLGSVSALRSLPPSIDAVVSLSREGTEDVPASIEGVRVWLIDEPGHNANLDFVLAEAADVIAALRADGKEVFVHCAEARSRTAAVSALYAIRHRDVEPAQAWADVEAALPYFAPARFHREAVQRIADHHA